MTDLKTIQTHLGIPADGVLGPQTLAAIAKALGVKPAAPANTFDHCLAIILRHEGGFVNHPKDPGGMTNLGVTKNTWEAWTGRPATEAEMRALTVDKVKPLYKARYWDACACDALPAGLALCVFDFAVNAGPSRAARYLQGVVRVSQDGNIGPETLGAVKAMNTAAGTAYLVKAYQDARRGYYRQLSTFATFGRGWMRRVDETETEALRLT